MLLYCEILRKERPMSTIVEYTVSVDAISASAFCDVQELGYLRYGNICTTKLLSLEDVKKSVGRARE